MAPTLAGPSHAEEFRVAMALNPSEISASLKPLAENIVSADDKKAMNIAKDINPGPRQLRERADKALLLGLLLQEENKPEEALGQINEAISLRPAFGLALLAKAKINFELKNYEEARASFDEALFFGLKSSENALTARKGLLESLKRLNREPEALILSQKFKAAGLL